MASLECAVGEEHVAATWESVEVDFERREEIFGGAGHSLQTEQRRGDGGKKFQKKKIPKKFFKI